MTWADFYLTCFAIGFAFSFLSFLLGSRRPHLHLPHGHVQLPHGNVHLPHAHASASSAATVRPSAGAGKLAPHATGGAKSHVVAREMPRVNFFTLAAFLAWFGGIGYLLTSYAALWVVLVLAAALAGGLMGAGIIFLFLNKVLISAEENLDPADYELAATLGRISVPIREGGTGEIIYTKGGTRRACGARADNGCAIAKGSEVVITR